MKINTSISISHPNCSSGEDYISVRVMDEASRLRFIEIKVGMAEFMKALVGRGDIKCEAEVGMLEHVGKAKESEASHVFISTEEYDSILEDVNYHKRGEILAEWLNKYHSRDGWYIDGYLGSRNSIVSVEGGKTLNFRYYRYVEQGGTQG